MTKNLGSVCKLRTARCREDDAPTPATETSQPTPTKQLERLEALSETVAACLRCQELASTRTQTVFGAGNPDASLMFIGEAPGAAEDRLGEPVCWRGRTDDGQDHRSLSVAAGRDLHL